MIEPYVAVFVSRAVEWAIFRSVCVQGGPTGDVIVSRVDPQ